MWLDDVTVALRPRNPWEAMDLGFALARREWRTLYPAWFAATLPLFVALNLAFYETAWLAGLLFWWLKPFYDRVVLHGVSQILFGSRPAVGESLRKALDFRRNGLFLALTLLRLDPARSFNLPAQQLEGLRGKARRRRQRVLNSRGRTHAVWLTIACMNLELVCYVSLLALGWLLVPETLLEPVYSALETGIPGGFDTASNLIYYIAVSIVEPGYVAGGFSLYVNRRTVLEGWDIELQFRRMARRLAAPAPVSTVFALLISATVLSGATDARASDGEDLSRRPGETPAEVIERVLSAPEFQTRERQETWAPKRGSGNRPESGGSLISPETAELIARIGRFLMWLAAGYLAFALALSLWRNRAGFRRQRPTPRSEPEQEPAAPPPATDAIPVDPAAAARALMDAGDARASLALLYRASLERLAQPGGTPVNAIDTESQVERKLDRLGDAALRDYLARLIAVWRLTAYRHTPPPEEQGATLIEEWAQRFPADAP